MPYRSDKIAATFCIIKYTYSIYKYKVYTICMYSNKERTCRNYFLFTNFCARLSLPISLLRFYDLLI